MAETGCDRGGMIGPRCAAIALGAHTTRSRSVRDKDARATKALCHARQRSFVTHDRAKRAQ